MLKLEPRPQPSRFWSFASPLLALAITVVIGMVLFAALGKDPVKGLQVFFWEPIKSAYALGELMVKATPLLIIALGLAVVLPLQRLEHRRRRPVRDRRGRRPAASRLLADKDTGALDRRRRSCWRASLGGMALGRHRRRLLRDKFNANEILVSLMLVYVARAAAELPGLRAVEGPGRLQLPADQDLRGRDADPAPDARARA